MEQATAVLNVDEIHCEGVEIPQLITKITEKGDTVLLESVFNLLQVIKDTPDTKKREEGCKFLCLLQERI